MISQDTNSILDDVSLFQMADQFSRPDFPDLELDERNTRPHQEIRMQYGDVRELDCRRAKRKSNFKKT